MLHYPPNVVVAPVAAITVSVGAVTNDAVHGSFDSVIGSDFAEDRAKAPEKVTSGVYVDLSAGEGAGADVARFLDEIFVMHGEVPFWFLITIVLYNILL